MTGLVTQVTYWPDGVDLTTEEGYDQASGFEVVVEWCGPRLDYGPQAVGGYKVTSRGSRQLSRAGKWAYDVPRFKRWQYRWATLDEAQEWAEKVRNTVVINGWTFAEWEAHFAARTEGTS